MGACRFGSFVNGVTGWQTGNIAMGDIFGRSDMVAYRFLKQNGDLTPPFCLTGSCCVMA